MKHASAAIVLALMACGSRSDLAPPPARSCKVDALATHACKTLVVDVPATQLDLGLSYGSALTQLVDRGDHVDAIVGTKVSSFSNTGSTMTVTASWDAFDLCGPIAESGDLFASLCNTPFTVFRVYDGAYARVTEREIATPSAATAIVGGAKSSWLVSWDGFAAVLGADTQPIVATVSETASFIDTPCGFVGIASSSTSFAADFAAPGGALTPFDSVDASYAPLVQPVRWPYDGASVAVMIGSSDGFDPPPNPRLDIIAPDETTSIPQLSELGTLLATPIGLVSIGTDGISVIGPDGSHGAALVFAPNKPSLGVAGAVWSSEHVVLVWQTYADSTPTTWGATVRCAD